MYRLAALFLVFPLVGCVGDVVYGCPNGLCTDSAPPDANQDSGIADGSNGSDTANQVDSSLTDAGTDSNVKDSEVADSSCVPDGSACGGNDCVDDGCGGVFHCKACAAQTFNGKQDQQCGLGTSLEDAGLTTSSTNNPNHCVYIIIDPGFSCTRDSANDFRCAGIHPYAWTGCSSTPGLCAVQSGSTCCP